DSFELSRSSAWVHGPARPETESTRGSFIFQRRRLGGPDCEAYWQRRTTWLCVLQALPIFHATHQPRYARDWFETKRLGREIAGAPQGATPISPAIWISRWRIGMARATAFA